jgi:serine/threonine protein kinase
MTKNSSNFGTIGYQAPELYMNGDFGNHSDIYSFGIMMFEILFEMPPYNFEDIEDQFIFKKDVKNGKRPNLEQFKTVKDVNLMILIGLMKQSDFSLLRNNLIGFFDQ